MPLLDGDSLPEFAKALYCLHKLFQSIVAFRVEFAVLKEFVHCFLLPLDEHLLEQDKSHLCNKQLVVVSIVTLHLSPFSGDFNDAVVVCTVEMFEFHLQIISLICKLLNHATNVLNLAFF